MYSHPQIIRNFLNNNPHYRATGMSNSLRLKLPDCDISFKNLGYIPDAFHLDDNCLYLLEVDKSSILDHKKLPNLLALWYKLDCLSIRMEMTIISGYTLTVSTIDDGAFERMWNDSIESLCNE